MADSILAYHYECNTEETLSEWKEVVFNLKQGEGGIALPCYILLAKSASCLLVVLLIVNADLVP